MRILIIEDEEKIGAYLSRGLEQDGHVVDVADCGGDGLALFGRGSYELVLLDLMLPDQSGFDVLQQISAKTPHPPVVILSAKASVKDRVRGLALGADDYMTKPFSFSELRVRIRAIMRRCGGGDEAFQSTELRVGELMLDRIRRQAFRGARVLDLTAREYALLEYFIQNQGCPITKRLIFEHVWNYSADPQTNVVDVLVCRLRDKLNDGESVKLIRTLRGVGYVLDVE